MDDLRQDLDTVMRSSVGVEVIDVRVKKIDLPSEVSSTVYERMNSERDIEARQYRAEGQEQALAIRAKADRDAVVLEAEAYRESEQLRGDGDAKAAEQYASAYKAAPSTAETNFVGPPCPAPARILTATNTRFADPLLALCRA